MHPSAFRTLDDPYLRRLGAWKLHFTVRISDGVKGPAGRRSH